tara:strand:+ start:384 stop:641 length:258 start_codon:yes stop_codon:yes gene_type:complete
MNKTLFWVAVIGIGAYYYKDNLGPITNSMGFGFNPTQDNDLTSESDNWWMKMMQATPALETQPTPYTGYRGQNPTTPTISGNFHL